ncbi:MAG: response regulator transcription factor [Thermoleophilia bacterium]
MPWSVLIVDDEPEILDIASAYLTRAEFAVRRAATGQRALDVIALQPPDLIILDLMLPDLSGEEVCATIRRTSDVPIIMLTARSAEADRLRGLALGADDFLVKPFSPRELVARARAVMRRAGGEGMPPAEVLVLDEGRLELDLGAMRAHLAGHDLELTATEFRILAVLVRPPGRLRSREELRLSALGSETAAGDRTIDAHVKNIRRKLDGCRAGAADLVRTVYGAGYRFQDT